MATPTKTRQQVDRFAIKATSVLSAEVHNALASLPDSSCNAAPIPEKSVAKPSLRPFLTVLGVQLGVVEERLKSGTQTEAKVRKLLAALERLSTARRPEVQTPYPASVRVANRLSNTRSGPIASNRRRRYRIASIRNHILAST